jgi:hypothetical protein
MAMTTLGEGKTAAIILASSCTVTVTLRNHPLMVTIHFIHLIKFNFSMLQKVLHKVQPLLEKI